MNYTKYEWIFLSAASVAAGVVNGLIGTGGGIILYFALKIQQKFNKDKEQPPDALKDIMANIIAVVVPMSIVSAVVYMIEGNIKYSELAAYIPAAVIGGIAGAFLLNKLKPKIVKKIFAAMIIYAGIRMIMSIEK